MSETMKKHWMDYMHDALAVIEEYRASGCYTCHTADTDDESYRCTKCRTLIAFADAVRRPTP